MARDAPARASLPTTRLAFSLRKLASVGSASAKARTIAAVPRPLYSVSVSDSTSSFTRVTSRVMAVRPFGFPPLSPRGRGVGVRGSTSVVEGPPPHPRPLSPEGRGEEDRGSPPLALHSVIRCSGVPISGPQQRLAEQFADL